MAWNANPWYEDDFNRTDSDTVGDGWNELSGDADIVSNQVKAIGGKALIRYDNLDLSETSNPADYVVEFEYDFDAGTQFVYICGRWDGTQSTNEPLNCYFLYIQPTGGVNYTIYLYERTSIAAQNLIDSYSGTFTGQLACRLEMLGTSIKGIIDGTEYVSATDSTHTSQGYAGARIDQNVTLDNFAIYSEDAPPTYLSLDEVLTMTDNVYKSTTRVLTNTITVVDNVLKSTTRIISEVLTLNDTISRQIARSLTNALTLTDTLYKSITRTLTNALALTDSISKSITRVLRDPLTITDSISALIVGFYQLILTETITLRDSLTSLKEWFSKTVSSWYTKTRDDEYN